MNARVSQNSPIATSKVIALVRSPSGGIIRPRTPATATHSAASTRPRSPSHTMGRGVLLGNCQVFDAMGGRLYGPRPLLEPEIPRTAVRSSNVITPLIGRDHHAGL